MFTGIIQKILPIHRVSQKTAGMELSFHDPEIAAGLKEGDSVAIDGICTTVKNLNDQQWSCDIGSETLKKTIAPLYRPRIQVNVELALQMSDRLNGHLVTGHVDGTGRITSIVPLDREQMAVTFSFPADLKLFMAYKGSITLQGVSLTLNEITRENARVNIVSYTYHHTTFHLLKQGDPINIETDLLAKYVHSCLTRRNTGTDKKAMWETLKNSGYV